MIVEASGPGAEVECSVLGHSEPIASVPGEIVANADWYDYEAKYEAGGMELRVPAEISESASERVRELALEVFALCGCSGLARCDFFVDGETVLVNELNTIPGFTETSVYAQAPRGRAASPTRSSATAWSASRSRSTRTRAPTSSRRRA